MLNIPHPGRVPPFIWRAFAMVLLVPTSAFANKGMPQLDFANPLTVSQIVWLVVVFVVLYLSLSAWALPKVGSVIGERVARIGDDLDRARTAKEAADAAWNEIRQATTRAHAEAQSEINKAVTDARAQAAEQAAARLAALDQRMAESEARLSAARAAALADLPGIAFAAASTMIERLSGKPADATAVREAIVVLLSVQTA